MDTGTKVYRNYFPIKFGWQCDLQYGTLYPCFRKLMYPGDVFKIHADLLIRYQPMLTPPMNDCIATVRFAFVPLRLIEENTELVVTGSNDGKLATNTIPVMDSVFKYLNVSNKTSVEKYSILDVLYGIPAGIDLSASGLLTKLDNDKASPAAYFAKAYYRFWWDYYRDENLDAASNAADFDSYWDNNIKPYLHVSSILNGVKLKKDRITSSLPWQLKAVSQPTILMNGTMSAVPDFGSTKDNGIYAYNKKIEAHESSDPFGNSQSSDISQMFITPTQPSGETNPDYKPSAALWFDTDVFGSGDTIRKGIVDLQSNGIKDLFKNMSVTSNMGFTAADLRSMMAQTRIFERLARCGSRYTEYLYANFGVAPADGTLQRAQYLGGFKTRIVTTEVVQTAADGANPVGTLRGHGITHGSSTIKPFMAPEIGVIIGVIDVKPETIYAQGVDRELTARSRFDFFIPSFQHLSEQEVRKGEVYFDVDTDSNGNLVNGQTWGFQPYAQELRSGIKHVCGDMRDTLSYWNQSLIMSSRPSLNAAFLNAHNHLASYHRPFAVSNVNAHPLIVDFGGIIEAYRPLVKNGTPGLVDHN